MTEAPGTVTNERTSFPAVLKAPRSEPYEKIIQKKKEPYENTQMGPVGGVQNQSDKMSGLSGSSKNGPVINGAVPEWTMGNRAVGDSVGSKEQMPERVIPDGEEPGIAPTYAVHDPLSHTVSHNQG